MLDMFFSWLTRLKDDPAALLVLFGFCVCLAFAALILLVGASISVFRPEALAYDKPPSRWSGPIRPRA